MERDIGLEDDVAFAETVCGRSNGCDLCGADDWDCIIKFQTNDDDIAPFGVCTKCYVSCVCNMGAEA